MREEVPLGLFERIETVYNRARIYPALVYFSFAEFEKANWPKEEGRIKTARRTSMELAQDSSAI